MANAPDDSSGVEALPDHDLFGLDVFQARHSRPRSDGPVTWSKTGNSAVVDKADLIDHIEHLLPGEVGTVTTEKAGWGRVQNVVVANELPRFIVDVQDGTSEGRVTRVFKGLRTSEYPVTKSEANSHHPVELFDARTASNVVWSWLRSGLPIGVLLVDPSRDDPEVSGAESST